MTRYFRPTQSFSTVDPDGRRVLFERDPVPRCLVPEGHWVLSGREVLFEPFDLDGQAARVEPVVRSSVISTAVEQATAAPGEKRAARRSRKPAAEAEPADTAEDAGD